jgi:hypothetical protein
VRVAYEPVGHQQGWLVLRVADGQHRIRRVDRSEYRALQRWAEIAPRRVCELAGQSLWLYRRRVYSGSTGLTLRQAEALMLTGRAA